MDDLSRRGIEHYNGGRFVDALRCFRAAVARGGSGPEAGVFLGHVAGSLGRRREAIAAFTAVIGDFPRRLPAYAGLANLLLHQSPARDRAAEKTLLAILTLKPEGAASRARLVAALRVSGQAFLAAGELQAAEKAFARALLLDGKDRAFTRKRLLDVVRARGQAHLAAGDLEKADRELTKAVALEPGHAQTRRGLIQLLHRRGLAHVSAGRFVPAMKVLRRALALSPRDMESRRQLAELLVARELKRPARARGSAGEFGRAEAALMSLRPSPRVSELRRRLAWAAARRGFAEMSRGRGEAGRRFLSRALAIQPRGPGSRGSLVALLRLCAKAWAAAGCDGRAENILTRALALSPRNAELRGDIARILRTRAIAHDVPNTRSRFRRVRRDLEAVLKMDPRDGSSRVSLSLLMRWIGRPQQEQAALRRAVAEGQELSRADRFKALMRLGRCAQAVRLAERMLDDGVSLLDLRAFWDPWEKDNRPRPEAPQTDIVALDRALKTAPGPWRQFYLGCLAGPEGLGHFDAIPAGGRYRWMHYNAAMEALFSGSFRKAVSWFNSALRHEPMDWRAHGYLAEAYACLDRPAQARREMSRGLDAAPENERAQVYAWRGELELWLGDYARSLELSTRACAMGAPFAHGWKGAALLKLGRRKEALAQLDTALRLYPKDAETRLWRVEAKRELGRCREALKDLETVRACGVWVLVNRALAKRALGDDPGMKADFENISAEVVDHVRRGIGLGGGFPLDAEQMTRVLHAALTLARGFRRDEYGQAVWLSRRRAGQ